MIVINLIKEPKLSAYETLHESFIFHVYYQHILQNFIYSDLNELEASMTGLLYLLMTDARSK